MSESTDLDYSHAAVPPEGRMSRLGLMMAWSGVASCFFFIVVGAAMAQAYGTVQALVGIVLASITFTVINQVMAQHAIKTGLNVSLLSLRLFGQTGAFLAPLILAATAIYYAVFEGSVMAQALHIYAPSIGLPVASAVVVLWGLVLISGSIQHWLDKVNGILLPFYLIGMAAAVILTIQHYGLSGQWLALGPADGGSATGWWHCYTYYLGISILMMYTYEYARFGRPADTWFHSRLTFGMPFYIMGYLFSAVVGIFLVGTIPGLKSSEVGVVIGVIELMGVFGLLFVWVTQSRINTANFFLATVNIEALVFQAFGRKIDRIWALAIAGVAVYVLMQANVFGYLLQALTYQGIFVVAWVGIALSYILRDGRTAMGATEQAGTSRSLRGLGAWCIAAAVGLVFLQVEALSSFASPATFFTAWLAETLLKPRGGLEPLPARQA